ncbi:MAG TPA: glycosyltransferase family 39 protein [Flavisolibacter sp.]
MGKRQKLRQPRETVVPLPALWLTLVVVTVYFASTGFGFTELDDTIFVRDFRSYYENADFVSAFRRGVFHATDDTYYRPLFLNVMMLNYRLAGDAPAAYHAVNIVLHLVCVLVLFRLLKAHGIRQWQAFLLVLVFAVHPVLSQAVSWIPGRNDTLMSLIVFGYFLFSLRFMREGRPAYLVLSFVALVLAMFTKETALLTPIASAVLLMVLEQRSYREKRMLLLFGMWLLAYIIYFIVRSGATLKESLLVPAEIAGGFIERLPLVLQYTGKIFFPFNLSVFPVQKDTTLLWGIAAIFVLGGLVLAGKEKNNRYIITGLALFIIFLLPALLVPARLNEQAFEHRLYLPLAGLLFLLPETVLFRNSFRPSTIITLFSVAVVLLAVLNIRHQQYFRDPKVFWDQAAATSPNSAYALMMHGARTDDPTQKAALFRRAYALNPNEKYLNFYYGLMLQEHDSVLHSEPYLLKEQQVSGYYECDFYLAKVDFQKNDLPGAAAHLERYLATDSLSTPANNNLLLLYIDLQQGAKAAAHIRAMERRGLNVPPQQKQQVQALVSRGSQ